jgi:hypothetical protein
MDRAAYERTHCGPAELAVVVGERLYLLKLSGRASGADPSIERLRRIATGIEFQPERVSADK